MDKEIYIKLVNDSYIKEEGSVFTFQMKAGLHKVIISEGKSVNAYDGVTLLQSKDGYVFNPIGVNQVYCQKPEFDI